MSGRYRRAKIALLAVIGLALVLCVGRLAGSHWTTPSAAVTTGPQASAPTPEGSTREPSDSSTPPPPPPPFESLAISLGENQYPNTYAGTSLGPGDRLVIYTTFPNATFRAAIAKLNTEHRPVRFAPAQLSFNQLNTISSALDKHREQLTGDGINLALWAPHAPYDAIYVWLLRPTNEDLQRLSTSGLVPPDLSPVTRSNYRAAAGAAIESTVGPNYRIQPAYGQPIKG